MRIITFALLGVVTIAVSPGQAAPQGSSGGASHVPAYTDGRLRAPSDYREWIYLTTGLDMSYTPLVAGGEGHSMFDNAFVNPEAYRSFLQTGTWPDKTTILLEKRGAERNGSINKSGHFQGAALMGLEVHVKDASRGGWAFYEFDSDKPATKVPLNADCYSCHLEHAAVDTTFVQFYPTLLPLAKVKRTLSANYLKDEGKP